MIASVRGRPVGVSRSEYTYMALPNDANPLGNVMGGRVMHLVDMCGSFAALRHARLPVVTASVDQMCFLHPVTIGQLLVLRSSVNRVFRTPWRSVSRSGGESENGENSPHFVGLSDLRGN